MDSIATGSTNGAALVPAPQGIPLLSDAPVRYNRNERRAVRTANKQQRRALMPARGPDGAVQYMFGQATPVVVCAPLRICDVALQPGEVVKDVLVGDSARWHVQPAMSGSGESVTTHAVIKPLDVGLSTNLMITTDRRVYHLTLKSARRDHMPFVRFTYPDTDQAAWRAVRERQASAQRRAERDASASESQQVAGLGLSVSDLNFDYTIQGNFGWRPERVFNDGIKTYIELPSEALVQEAPILLVPHQGRDEIVNYRLKANRFVVDALVPEIVLVRGVGYRQERIRIVANGAIGGSNRAGADDAVHE